jgi:succinoglycan biosynthesis transport protein ExoP
MSNLEKYLDQVMEQRPVVYETPLEVRPEVEPEGGKPDLLRSITRRWYIVLATTVVVGALGVPAIWLLVKPRYVVQGQVRVMQAQPSVLTGQPEGDTSGSYRTFLNTQAQILNGNRTLLGAIADELQDRQLAFFSGRPSTLLGKLNALIGPGRRAVDPVKVLREALADNKIVAGPVPNTELLTVTMKSTDSDEARIIVDSFLRNYKALYGPEADPDEIETRRQLEDEQKALRVKITDLRRAILDNAKEFGSTELDSRQDMEMTRQTALLADLTRLELRKITLETRIAQLDPNEKASISPEQMVALRTEYVNSDQMVAELSSQIVEMKRDLIIAKQAYKPGHPVLAQKEEILAALERSLEDTRRALEEKFEDGLDDQLKVVAEQQRAAAAAELGQVTANIDALKGKLEGQDSETIRIGQKNLEIQETQSELDLSKGLYDQISRRIQTMDIEGERRSRIQIASYADVVSVEDKRVKFTAGMAFFALGCGLGLALLRDRMDKTLQTPEDVSQHLDLPMLGTTSSSHTVKPSLFAEQIAADYQTIRTNLGLLTNGGMPHMLAVSSPGMREGKTTFAVNLATSLAKSGKRVLLVDGDLRKPDVRYMLNISNGSAGVQDVLMGEEPEKIICSVPTSGLHVLPANPRKVADVYELLVSSKAAEQVERLGREYDHLIIDTPPVLAFPDALVWAKLTGAVVLVGFAGHTTAPELKEAKERFTRVRVQVLGAILSNVRVDQSLYRYAYGYRTVGVEPVRKVRKQRRLLLSTQNPNDATKNQS